MKKYQWWNSYSFHQRGVHVDFIHTTAKPEYFHCSFKSSILQTVIRGIDTHIYLFFWEKKNVWWPNEIKTIISPSLSDLNFPSAFLLCDSRNNCRIHHKVSFEDKKTYNTRCSLQKYSRQHNLYRFRDTAVQLDLCTSSQIFFSFTSIHPAHLILPDCKLRLLFQEPTSSEVLASVLKYALHVSITHDWAITHSFFCFVFY